MEEKEVVVDQETKKRKRTSSIRKDATIIAAIITGIFVLVAAYIQKQPVDPPVVIFTPSPTQTASEIQGDTDDQCLPNEDCSDIPNESSGPSSNEPNTITIIPPTRPVSPTALPTSIQVLTQASVKTNFILNGDFDTGIVSCSPNERFIDTWCTDNSTTISTDTQGNGYGISPSTSIKLVSTSRDIHLFSPKMKVEYQKTYEMSAFLNIKQVSPEKGFGFYIDEYNSNGSWINGHNLPKQTGPISEVKQLPNYTPSSNDVSYVCLQFIVYGNSNTLVYIDSVKVFSVD